MILVRVYLVLAKSEAFRLKLISLRLERKNDSKKLRGNRKRNNVDGDVK